MTDPEDLDDATDSGPAVRTGALVRLPELRALDLRASRAIPEHDAAPPPWTCPADLRAPAPVMETDEAGEVVCVQDRPCITLAHADPRTPSLVSLYVDVQITDETIDPAWWREQLGPVAFELTLYEAGNSTPYGISRGVRLGSFGPDTDPGAGRRWLRSQVVEQRRASGGGR
jgi:hypothetical protein